MGTFSRSWIWLLSGLLPSRYWALASFLFFSSLNTGWNDLSRTRRIIDPKAFSFMNHKIHWPPGDRAQAFADDGGAPLPSGPPRPARDSSLPALSLLRDWSCICVIKRQGVWTENIRIQGNWKTSLLKKPFWKARVLLTNVFRLTARYPSITSSCLPSRPFICA